MLLYPFRPPIGVIVRSDGKQNFIHFKQISIPNGQHRNSDVNQIARTNKRKTRQINSI